MTTVWRKLNPSDRDFRTASSLDKAAMDRTRSRPPNVTLLNPSLSALPMYHFLSLVILLSLFIATLRAEDPPKKTDNQQSPTELSTVVVTGKAEDLLGVAPSASKGQASAEEIADRPYLRRGEILETVPGLIVTQHAGGGKANQYFLRGFNLDHGTDFATSIDDMPMNMKTHAHGQGYTDLNPLIPEMVERVDYVKGTYTAANGDLSTAGSANFKLFDLLPKNLASFEIGEHGYYRGLIAGSLSLDVSAPFNAPSPGEKNPGSKPPAPAAAVPETNALTYALEYNSYDGPWLLPEKYQRYTGLLKWFKGDEDNHVSLTFMGYHGSWQSSDQVAQRAITSGLISRFGNLNATDGGKSQRYSLNFEYQTRDGNVVTKANAYAIYYDLDLFSDFTYFLNNPVHGDQFEQQEHRWVLGGNVSRTWEKQTVFGHEADVTIGIQTRHDVIDGAGLYQTEARSRLSTVRLDNVYEASIGAFADATIHWNDWFRTQAGLRADLYYFDVTSSNSLNSGDRFSGIVSPKFSAIFGPWEETELYLNFGTGFHSNDARGITTTQDPATSAPVDKVQPLVRTMGAELGVRTQVIPHLTSTLTLYWLESDSELTYSADAGRNDPGPASRRVGIEWSNYWRPSDWFSLDGEIALTHGRFLHAGSQSHITDSVPLMLSAGVNFGAQGDADGFFSNLRLRYIGGRPLVEDNSHIGKVSLLLNGSIGYRHKHWETAVECLNILDRHDNDIEYYYTSRLPGEPAAGINDVALHPTEPRSFRFRVTYRF